MQTKQTQISFVYFTLSYLDILNNLLTIILINLTINLDYNPLIPSIWCQVHPGLGGQHEGELQQQDDQYRHIGLTSAS